MNRIVFIRNVGRINYANALLVQKTLEKHVLEAAGNTEESRDTILVLEHDPVYTIGLRTRQYPQEEEVRLRALGADYHRSDRGGLVTFHGPGQLVVYPILYLGNFRKSVKWYVCALEQTLIATCRRFGVDAKTTTDTGVWVGNDKIAAIGIHARRFVTTHGIALNCNVDLGWFRHIVPCGIPNKGVTSLSRELSRDITVGDAIQKFVESFEENFDCRVVSSSCDNYKYTNET